MASLQFTPGIAACCHHTGCAFDILEFPFSAMETLHVAAAYNPVAASLDSGICFEHGQFADFVQDSDGADAGVRSEADEYY